MSWHALTRGTIGVWWVVSSLKVLGALVLWRGVFLFLPLNCGRVAGRPDWPWMYGPLLTLRVSVCSQLAPVLPLGGCMSMWVVAHTVAVATYCFSLCVAVFITPLPLFTVRRFCHTINRISGSFYHSYWHSCVWLHTLSNFHTHNGDDTLPRAPL
jgi:hypothetical protein